MAQVTVALAGALSVSKPSPSIIDVSSCSVSSRLCRGLFLLIFMHCLSSGLAEGNLVEAAEEKFACIDAACSNYSFENIMLVR